MPGPVRYLLCVGMRVALLPPGMRVPVLSLRVRVPLPIARPALTVARLPLARRAALAIALLALAGARLALAGALLALAGALLPLAGALLPLAMPARMPARAVRLRTCRGLPVGCELSGWCHRLAGRRAVRC